MKSAEIRQKFLDYFARNGHQVVPSSSLVPGNDATLLFTNAGMVQFKDVFLGRDQRDYTRATSVQRCVRAGGKHNDLENVGYTARHHTFFEMLGNFSFGDYFKRDAIHYAWEFLTKDLGLPPERLWVTVYEEDTEATDVWLKEIGADPARFTRIGDKPGGKRYESDNFWSMGDTGPCGPCSEIFYDHGKSIAGGPPGSPDEDGDRYVEIWNLVFMQYDRDQQGELTPLPKPSVDTGMGLERLAAVLQGVTSNYDTDIFQGLIRAAAKILNCEDQAHTSLKVVADHIRSSAFLIVDGVLPSNEGRGYVLRRIIRRAIRHGYQLGAQDIFFWKLVSPLVDLMGAAYPELVSVKDQVEKALKQEEERFALTLEQGMKLLEEAIENLKGKTIPGEVVFKLYDTYGFPVDLTQDIAREKNLVLDMAGFDTEMAKQRDRARAASGFKSDASKTPEIDSSTEFTGYSHLAGDAHITQIIVDGENADHLDAGQEGMIILEQTPFYAESGGQTGDQGKLIGENAVFVVEDAQKAGRAVGHIGKLRLGSLKKGDLVRAEVDEDARKGAACHHSATHLLHAALRKVLGPHVQQKGSLVEAERLRFDFAHPEAVTNEQLEEIERLVNQEIRANQAVKTEIKPLDEAINSGAMALFGEKYDDDVRVVSMGAFSTELCGGTHVARTGDIGMFRIAAESGIASGVRRIEAVTAQAALNYSRNEAALLHRLMQSLKATPSNALEKTQQLHDQLRRLEKENQQLKSSLASKSSGDIVQDAVEIGGIKVLITRLDNTDVKTMRDTLDNLRNKLGSSIVVIMGENEGKIQFIAGVSKDNVDHIKAGDIARKLAGIVGGKGGGRPDMAQGGGGDVAKLDQAKQEVSEFISANLT